MNNAKNTHQVKAVTVHLTDKCNLICSYCFSKDYRVLNSMTEEIAVAFANWFVGQSTNGKYSITFFGGEPFLEVELMAIIIDTIHANKKKDTSFVYSATTNGTLIDSNISKFIKKNKINVMLSTDGDVEYHNLYRKFPNGQGSYDCFAKGLSNVKKVQPKITGRMTFTPETVGALVKNHEFLLFEHKLDKVAATPTVEADWDEQTLSILEEQIYQLSAMLLEYWSKGQYLHIHLLEKEVYDISSDYTKKKVYPCGAGRKMAGVGIDGTIYPCHRFVGMNEFKIGSIFTGIAHSKTEMFWNEPVKTDDACATNCDKCKLNKNCRGFCYCVNYLTTGDIKIPPFNYFRIKEIYIKVVSKLYKYLIEYERGLLEKMLKQSYFI